MEDAQDFLNIDQVLDKDHFYINEEVRISSPTPGVSFYHFRPVSIVRMFLVLINQRRSVFRNIKVGHGIKKRTNIFISQIRRWSCLKIFTNHSMLNYVKLLVKNFHFLAIYVDTLYSIQDYILLVYLNNKDMTMPSGKSCFWYFLKSLRNVEMKESERNRKGSRV